ncbi:MAG: endonuclease [Candidatus Amulumruptor caecigallinarius]|nr:endonuclease [Candidatus Amulumruptor caecigallinarius]MCM1396792.1 endonuclease [Candidatus Amulumruptor caecigallinarius]MCM1454513.1 endonuclease [bacterium]
MNKLLHIITVVAMGAVSLSAAAQYQYPTGYYNTLDGKTGADLKSALHAMIQPKYSNLTSYSSYYYNKLPEYFQRTDAREEGGVRYWWDMYSNIPFEIPSFKGLNREHSFPKSWWGGAQDIPPYIDLNHLYPSEAAANQAKSNYPLGEVASATFDNSVVRVGSPMSGQGGQSKFVFEPNEEYKGDFARTYFYMVTCYSNLTWNPSYSWMLRQDDYPTLKDWAITLLLKWHREDPVSDKETARNNAVYSIQSNRNPFIDLPELAEYIWGSEKGNAFHPGAGGSDMELISPEPDITVDFNQVALGMSATSNVLLRTNGATNKVKISIYDAANPESTKMFSVSHKEVSAADANAGVMLTVTYTPTDLGNHASRLVFGGFPNLKTYGVSLLGECLPKPTLTAPVATDATDITDDSYVAHWSVPESEDVDYYEVTRVRHKGTTELSEVLLAEENFLEITDFADSDYDTYSVRSVRLGCYSSGSNTVTVLHDSSIERIPGNTAIDFVPVPGGVYVNCGLAHSVADIYDVTGRHILHIDPLVNGMTIRLAPGIYIADTPLTAPVKMMVE